MDVDAPSFSLLRKHARCDKHFLVGEKAMIQYILF